MNNQSGAEHFPPFPVLNAYAGNVVYPPGGQFGPRVQQDVQLVMLHSGVIDVTIDDVPHHVRCGYVALLKPGHREQFYFSRHQDTWHQWIAITVGSLSAYQLNRLEQLPFYLPMSDAMTRLTEMMLSFDQEAEEHKGLLISLGISAIQLYELESLRGDDSKNTNRNVILAKKVIERKYAEPLFLSDIAMEVNLSPAHLIRLFRQNEGMTPMQYLWSFRVKRGLQLLKNTGLSISEIAEQTGFKTSFHFARLTKQHVGMSPTDYRKLHIDMF